MHCPYCPRYRYTGEISDGATARLTTNQTHALRVRLVVFSTPDDIDPGDPFANGTDITAAGNVGGFYMRFWVTNTPVLEGLPLCDESFIAHGPGYFTPPEGLYVTSDLAWRRSAAGISSSSGSGAANVPTLPTLPGGGQDPRTWLRPYQPNTTCTWRFNLPAGAVAKLVFMYLDTGATSRACRMHQHIVHAVMHVVLLCCKVGSASFSPRHDQKGHRGGRHWCTNITSLQNAGTPPIMHVRARAFQCPKPTLYRPVPH